MQCFCIALLRLTRQPGEHEIDLHCRLLKVQVRSRAAAPSTPGVHGCES